MAETGPLGGLTLDAPVRFGDFTLLKRIATGGTAEIYLARRHGLEGFVRHLAIKRVLPHLADNPDFVQLILDEARLAAHLHHGHIIEIHQVGVSDNQAFIAMEYLPGMDLGRLVRAARRRRRRVVVAHGDPGLARALAHAIDALDLADVVVAPGPEALREVTDSGPVDLLVLDTAGLAATRDPVLAAVQAAHPELLRTILVGPTGGRGFGTYSVVEPTSNPDEVARLAAQVLAMALPPELTVQVMRAVFDALDYAHTASDFAGRPLEVVHRDINPSNVLVSINGSVKLVDFGIARATTTLRREVRGNFVGTYAYMSPEQASGRAADGRSDLFSVGTLLYELLAGVNPFAGDNEFATMRAIRECTPEPLDTLQPGLPPVLGELTARALAKVPDARHLTARDMLRDLEGVIRRDGVDLNPKRLAGFLAVVHGQAGVAAFGVSDTGYAPQPPHANGEPSTDGSPRDAVRGQLAHDVAAAGRAKPTASREESTQEREEPTYDRSLDREPTTLNPRPLPPAAVDGAAVGPAGVGQPGAEQAPATRGTPPWVWGIMAALAAAAAAGWWLFLQGRGGA